MKKFAVIIGLLVPMMMLAQQLMLLNHPRRQGEVSYLNDVTYFYGDSITLGYNPNPPKTNLASRFSTLLSTQFSLIESNYGVGGSQIADAGEADLITANNAISATNISVWLAGYNDVLYYGTNTAALADNETALASLVAWLAVPTSLRVPWNATNNFPSPGNIYYSPGDWGFFPGTLGGLAYSKTAGANASFYFSGSTLLIGTARGGGSGNATVVVGDVVDSVLIPTRTNIYSCLRTSADTGAGRSYSPGLILFTNLSSATNHYAFFTAQSTAFTFLGWVASFSTNQLPKVVLAGTLKIDGSNYTDPNLPAGFLNGSDLAAEEYSQMISNVAVTLSAAKLNVKWVPAPLLDTNTDWEFDGIHPNESGHLKIKKAIEKAF